MSQPTVCCVMLVNGRAEMVRRAIASFRAQTYENKRLVVWDSTPSGPISELSFNRAGNERMVEDVDGFTIGKLRNRAANWSLNHGPNVDLFAHFDSDDWSHPNRLAEQVALIETTSKLCVGYRELLFWDTREDRNEAWIYRNDDPRWAAGASFLYRRELWEQQPFPDSPHEDQRWWLTPLVIRNCVGVSAIPPMTDPRMVCQMHSGGTEQIPRKVMLSGGGGVWRRAPEMDAYCERTMRL